MTEPGTATVPPRFAKMLGTLVVGNLGLAGGIFMVFGWGPIQSAVCASIAGLSALLIVVGAVRQRPRVVITSEGFALHSLFASRTRKWEDIDGPFAVINLGTRNFAAYKLTADCKARVGKKPASRFSGHQGYDEVIMGDFRLSAEELAELLNEHAKCSIPSRDEAPGAVSPAQTSVASPPAPAGEAPATGNGSPILRALAGVMALLLAGVVAVLAAAGKGALGGLVVEGIFALVFGWYAVLGRKGLPRFFTRKWNEPAPPSSMTRKLMTAAGLIAFGFLLWHLTGGGEQARARKTAERLSAAAKATNPQEQIRLFTGVIESDPKSADAYFGRGCAYGQKGDPDRAIADFTEALRLNPQYAEVYGNRGFAFCSKGDYDKAVADCTRAIQLNPQLAEAYNIRGYAYSAKGDHDKAIADFAKAIQLNPQFVLAFFNRGLAFCAKRDYDKAVADFTKSIQLNPRYAEAYSNRGFVYSSKGDYDKAIADCTKAIQLSPQLAFAYLNRGYAYSAKGDYDNAWADVKKCRELGGTPDPALIEDLTRASGRSE